MAARDLVEYVAKSLVDDPSAVTVDVIDEDGTTVIELHVAEGALNITLRSVHRRRLITGVPATARRRGGWTLSE